MECSAEVMQDRLYVGWFLTFPTGTNLEAFPEIPGTHQSESGPRNGLRRWILIDASIAQ